MMNKQIMSIEAVEARKELKSVKDIDALLFLSDSVVVLSFDPNKRKMISFAHPLLPYSNIELIYKFISEDDIIGFKKVSQGESNTEVFAKACKEANKVPDVFIRRSILEEDGALGFAKPSGASALIRVFIPYERSDYEERVQKNSYYPENQRFIISRVSRPDVFFECVLGMPLDNPAITSILLRIEIMEDL